MNPSTTQKLLTGVLILQGLFVAGHWLGQPNMAQARGEMNLPNPSERQLQMVDELKTVNTKLDKLIAALTTGEMQVKVVKDEK